MSGDYNFSVDMGFKRTQVNLQYILSKFGAPNTIVEIGCFEGATTCWCAERIAPYNPGLKIYALDIFNGFSNQEKQTEESVCTTKNVLIDYNQVKQRFLYNISQCDHKVIELIEGKSDDTLIDLIKQGVKAELVYVDGDHSAAGVLQDMILSWKLLPLGGVMICDDAIGWKYSDSSGSSPVQLSPRMGIEMFIQSHWHKIELISLPDSFQVAFVKTHL